MTHYPPQPVSPALRTMGEYLTSVADRFRNPMSAFLGAAESTYGVNPGFGSPADLERIMQASRGELDPVDPANLSQFVEQWGPGTIPGGGMLGVIDDIPAPIWNRAKKSIPVGKNPTKKEFRELFKEDETLRTLFGKGGVNDGYFWPASDAFHHDVGAYYRLNPGDYEHGILTRGDLL